MAEGKSFKTRVGYFSGFAPRLEGGNGPEPGSQRPVEPPPPRHREDGEMQPNPDKK